MKVINIPHWFIMLLAGLLLCLPMAYGTIDQSVTGKDIDCTDSNYVYCNEFNDAVFNDTLMHNQNPSSCTQQDEHIRCVNTNTGSDSASLYWGNEYKTLTESQSFCIEWAMNESQVNGNEHAFGVGTVGWTSGGKVADTFISGIFRVITTTLNSHTATALYKYRVCHNATDSNAYWTSYNGSTDSQLGGLSYNDASVTQDSGLWILNFQNQVANYYYMVAWNGTSSDAPYDAGPPPDTDNPYFTHTLEDFNRTNFDIASWSYDINATDDTSSIDTFTVNDTNFNITNLGLLTMLTPYPTGVYPLNITINDTSNNQNSSTMTVRVTQVNDTTDPTILLVSPPNESLQLTPFDITFTPSDDGDNDLICELSKANATLSYPTTAFWRMEEGSGTNVTDSSGNEHHGVNTGPAEYHASKGSNNTGDYGLYFDGTNDWIDIEDSDDLSFGNAITDNPFSMGAWVWMNSSNRFRFINKQADSTNAEWLFTTSASNNLLLYLYDGGAGTQIGRSTSFSLASMTDRWIHITAVYDGNGVSGGIKLYINGTRVDDTTNNVGSYVAMHNTNANIEIGSINMGSNKPTVGIIDEAFIIADNLTSAEILAIMDNGLIDLDSKTVYDTGIFTKDVNSTLTYNDALPNEFQLICYDNSLNNNSQTMELSYDTDIINPVLTITAPTPGEAFQLQATNITVNFSCSDTNFEKMNVSISNGTEILRSNQTTSDTFLDIFPSTNLGLGSHTLDFNCYDTVGNNDNTLIGITVTESPFPVITLDLPLDNHIFTPEITEFPYPINFTYNVSLISNCTLYLDSVNNQTQVATNSSLNTFVNVPFGNETTSKDWYVSCDDGLFMTDSATRSFTIDIFTPTTPHEDAFGTGQCPDTVPLALIFGLMIAIIVALIVYGEIVNMAILHLLASAMIFVLAWVMVGCLAFFGFILGLSGIVILGRGFALLLND